jgi:hypothetical protein
MANSSSFTLDNTKYKNSICFASFNRSSSINRKIIIEPEKQFYKYPIIKSYLNDLKKMGFDYEEFSKDKEGNINIITNSNNYKNKNSIGQKIAFSMLVRYLWEGEFTNTNDKFYMYFDQYLILKKILKNHNKLMLMCLSHTIVNASGNFPEMGSNANHMLSYSENCAKLKKSIDGLTDSVNGFFTGKNINAIIKSQINKLVEEKDYEQLITYINSK